jgi:hypothetical protein
LETAHVVVLEGCKLELYLEGCHATLHHDVQQAVAVVAVQMTRHCWELLVLNLLDA